MKVISKIAVLLIFIAMSGLVNAQRSYKPFEASIYVGAGAGTLIDYISENNIDSEFWPNQAGLRITRKLNSSISMTSGINYAKRGYYKAVNYSPHGVNIHQIMIRNIDIPVSINYHYPKIKRVDFYNFIGFLNSIIVYEPHVKTILTIDLDPNTFRKYYVLFHTGLGIQPWESFRFSLATNISFLSIVKPSYKPYFVAQTDYFGPGLVPIEIIISAEFVLPSF